MHKEISFSIVLVLVQDDLLVSKAPLLGYLQAQARVDNGSLGGTLPGPNAYCLVEQ